MSDPPAPAPVPVPAPAPAPAPEQIPDTADTQIQVKEEESTTLPSPTISVGQADVKPGTPSFSPTRSIRRTERQRLASLRNDPDVQEVEPQRVLCRPCQRWIRLSPNTNYSASNWHTHKQRCPGSPSGPRFVRRTPSKPSISPGSRVAATERKIVLLNDPQVKVCLPTYVQCGRCMAKVALGGEVDYDLTTWMEHKENCVPTTPAPITPHESASHRSHAAPRSHSQVSAAKSARSPTPTSTAVPEPAAATVGAKRGREEEEEREEDAVGVDARPTNRPRTETYAPPPPGLLGWFMRPLEAFARGFREGLGSASTT